jgi:SMODS and SLOG-associating 2TM effector domain 1/SMODS and SLOG-associating 2TM effector domain 3
MLLRRDEDIWYRARAVAESVKTSCWRFMMRTDPYLGAADVREVKSRFRDRLKSILKEHKDLSPHLGGPVSAEEQITERMCEIRRMQWNERAEFYRKYRIDEQRSWYAKKSAWNRRQGTIWLSVLIACQSLAVVFVIMRVAYPTWGYWPSEVFVVAAGSALTWIQAKRFRELAAAYALTAHEVGIVRGELEGVDSESQLAEFVVDSENAFSREHTQWLARKDAVTVHGLETYLQAYSQVKHWARHNIAF